MKRTVFLVVAVMAYVAGGMTLPAAAQATTSTGEYVQPHYVDVTFPFVAGGKTLPAGRYDIEQPTQVTLIFRSVKPTGPAVEVPVVTRLAARSTPVTEPKVVFDKVGGKDILSEVWFPGQDGFLLAATKEAHTHHHVKATKK